MVIDIRPPVCHYCGKLATCHGPRGAWEAVYACDQCCGHGDEDGKCERVWGGLSEEQTERMLERFRRSVSAEGQP